MHLPKHIKLQHNAELKKIKNYYLQKIFKYIVKTATNAVHVPVYIKLQHNAKIKMNVRNTESYIHYLHSQYFY